MHHHPLNGFDAYGLLGEAYRDFCKPEFSRPYFENRYDDDYSPTYSALSERSELGSNSRTLDTILNGGKAFAHGFLHGIENPFKAAHDNSGIGLFVNYMANTEQSNFNQYQTSPEGMVVQFCDKAGEICGGWIVLAPAATILKGLCEFGYMQATSYIARHKSAQQLILDGSIASGQTTLIAERVLLNEGTLISTRSTSQLTEVVYQESDAIIKIADKLTGYTSHGLNQAIGRNCGRGVNIREMWNTLKEPKQVIAETNGVTKFIGDKATVIVNSEGKLITTFGKPRGPQVWNASGVVQPK